MKDIVFTDIHTHTVNNHASDIVKIESIDIVSNPFIKDQGFFSVGIHPWHLPQHHSDWYLHYIDKILKHEKCLGIGECGLDFNFHTDHTIQKKIFQDQLQLANQHNKPVIIHCVRAFHEIIRIKKTNKYNTVWIIHGFAKSAQTANQCIDAGIYLSLGENIFNPNMESLVKSIPDEFLFFETDNSTTDIRDIYKRASNIRCVVLETLAKTVMSNFRTVFGIL